MDLYAGSDDPLCDRIVRPPELLNSLFHFWSSVKRQKSCFPEAIFRRRRLSEAPMPTLTPTPTPTRTPAPSHGNDPSTRPGVVSRLTDDGAVISRDPACYDE